MKRLAIQVRSEQNDRNYMQRIIITIAQISFVFMMIVDQPLAFSNEKQIDKFLPMEKRISTWNEIVGNDNYKISNNGLEASFQRIGEKWTIIGANSPIVNPTVYPADWPIRGNDFEVLVIPEPITNYKILPFDVVIENAVSSDTLSIVAAKDSYEPASFVLRSGAVPLCPVTVEVTDLIEINENYGKRRSSIPKEKVDIRIVKCWYQAGVKLNDITHKVLTPELLLHDDDLVVVDHDRQVNIIKNIDSIRDSDHLQSFIVPQHQNKQVWLTAHIDKDVLPGKYQGKISILVGGTCRFELKLEIDVLPLTLPNPIIEYMLFYHGQLTQSDEMHEGMIKKSEAQMAYELLDMKEHGLTNCTVSHQMSRNKDNWESDWVDLDHMLTLRKTVGWDTKPLLYLDWHPVYKDDLNSYIRKVRDVVNFAHIHGIDNIYIYGVDEKKGIDLFKLRPLYNAVHEAGAKNFVACTEDFLLYVPDLLYTPILSGKPPAYFMTLLQKLNIDALTYGKPQAGYEEPETYRKNFGIQLVMDGFSGVLDFAYQTEPSWNDFTGPDYRSHTMAYPTSNKPIPTIQWEGWREGVNDVRYLTLLLRESERFTIDWVEKNCVDTTTDCRKRIISQLLGSRTPQE